MALTANAIPSQIPNFITPFDANMSFNSAENLTATGYLGSGKQLDIGPGRVLGFWTLDTTVASLAADESYRFHLLGSNDSGWANGTVELIAARDYGFNSAARPIATIMGASLAIPPTGLTGLKDVVPFSNLRSGIVYRYVRAYLVAAGTTKSITLSSWLSPIDGSGF